jgi:CBS domain containing-hemolysin-like protein
MLILLLVVTLLLTGFFAGLEIAFVSANKLSIELKKKQGKRSGIIISHFFENPSRFIGVCLIGFNIFLVAYGLIIAEMLEPFWKATGITAFDQSGTLRLLAEVTLSTFIVLIVEFIFKAIFRAKNDSVLSLFAGVANLAYNLFSPISSGFVAASNWLLKYLFNVQIEDPKRPFSRIDLEHYYQQSKEAEEENSELNQELFENALSLSGVKVRSCLVPRKEIVGVDINTPIADVAAKMVETQLSKLVVYQNDIDTILGYVHQLDLFKQPEKLEHILLAIPAVPESMSITDLIGKLTKERKSMAWVVDEFGGTAGIVTMEDLLEEIFGEIRDEYDTDELVDKQLAENEFIFGGRTEMDYLREKYNMEFEEDDSETISGYIINHHASFPRQGEKIIINDYQFEILNMSDTRIELVKMKLL